MAVYEKLLSLKKVWWNIIDNPKPIYEVPRTTEILYLIQTFKNNPTTVKFFYQSSFKLLSKLTSSSSDNKTSIHSHNFSPKPPH
jgi:hypothetical protein